MAWRALLVAAVALFGAANADMCLSLPDALGPGEGCGGVLSCRRGLFCHPKEGVCTRQVKVGDLCKDASCERGSSCRGRGDEDLARCVADVHPGQDCSGDSWDLLGRCGTGVCSDHICSGGQINDACFIDDHCIGELKCVGHVCTSPLKAGDECDSTDECPLGHFCDNEAKCQAYLNVGSNCTQNTGGCAHGLICARRVKDATDRFCQERESLTSGQFCDNNNDNLCESLLCHNGHCAKETPNYCVGGGQCPSDQKCACSSRQMVGEDNFGRCTKDRCFQRILDYEECAYENCKVNANNNLFNYFNGSCVQRNCDKLYKRRIDCGSASSLSLSLSLLVAAPILSSLFSKLF